MAFFATGELFGWSEADMLSGLRKAQNDLSAGSSLISVTSGDVAQQRIIQNNARERIILYQRGLYELYLQDSLTYSAYAYFDLAGQSTTRGFIGGCSIPAGAGQTPVVSQGTNFRVKNGMQQVLDETDGLWYTYVAQTVNGVKMMVLSQTGEA